MIRLIPYVRARLDQLDMAASVGTTLKHEPEPALLVNVQAFLAYHLERLAPDSLLALAWERFYRTYNVAICGLVRRYRLPKSEADDVVQEVWAEVVARLPNFRWNVNRPGLRCWLYQLVKTKTMDIFRRQKRRPVQALPWDARNLCLATATVDALQAHEPWDRELLLAAVDSLRKTTNARSFAVLELQYVEGRTSAEVAETLGLTLDQVRYRRKRLLRRLRAEVCLLTGRPLGGASARVQNVQAQGK